MGKENKKYRGQEGWVCPFCKQARGPDLHDPCIRDLPGILFACCGHGGIGPQEGYLYFENGVRIGMVVTSIQYDDHRDPIVVPGRTREQRR
jgi:hypothetical protein